MGHGAAHGREWKIAYRALLGVAAASEHILTEAHAAVGAILGNPVAARNRRRQTDAAFTIRVGAFAGWQ